MTSILLMLLLSVIRAQRVFPVPSCPASCLVCSDDAVICHRLAHIIVLHCNYVWVDAPGTTQALLLTEGSISAVQPASLSDLSNITVIGLSHNRISVLGKESFINLPFLHTLLLDHNLLTGQALQGGALSNLTRLEVLALGHNLISMFQASWLDGSKSLRSLNLEGNLLTSLDSGSFRLKDLRDLESLDVSDNRISHLDRNSFHGLVGLRTLDLSRNRLSSAPAEAFSYLSWLTNLNLDLNSWNCSCQLLELAAFLSAFIQQPDQTLYNGRRMVCVSADNPAITTVLELTEANCVPSNQNITVQVQTSDSVTPQLYARDLAITAVICFVGGVGLTLLVVLIYYQVSRRKKMKEQEGQREKEEGGSTVANHLVNHHDVSEKRRDLFLQANNSQPWDKDTMMLDARLEGQGGQFRCPDCGADAPRLNLMKWDGRMNGGMESEEDRERRRVRMMMMMEEERRKPGTCQEILDRDIPNKLLSHSNSNSSSYPWRERPESLVAYKTQKEMGESYRTGVESKSRGQEVTHCESCNRIYRSLEHNMRQGRVHTNTRDSALFDSFPTLNRLSDRDRNVNYNQFGMMKDLRREPRNVTFDLESSRSRNEEGSGQGKVRREHEMKTSRDKDRGRERKHKAKALKVKLNLNPLRKSKVHPKKKSEHSEKSCSTKSKDKRRDAKERGEKEGKGSSGKKTKGSSEHVKKSAKTKQLIERDADEEQGEKEGEKGSKSLSKQKKATSKSGKGGQDGAEGDQGEKTQPENSKHTSSDTPNPADQSQATKVEGTSAIGQGAGLRGAGIQYQGAGLDLRSAQLSSQQPFPLSASERIRTTNLSLMGSAASLLTGSSLSLQGGNLLLNNMAPVTNELYHSGPSNTFAPSIGISGPNMVPSAALDSFGRQAGVSLISPATAHLVNTAQSNPLQASAIQTALQTQIGGLAQNLAANPAIIPAPIQSLSQSQMPPDSTPLVAKLKPEPAQEPGLQTGKGLHHVSPESQATERHTLPTQAPIGTDGSSEVTSQVTAPVTTVTTVENLSNNNSQKEDGHVPGESTVGTSAGGVALSGGSAMGVSGGSMMAAADMSVSGVSAQSGSSTGSALMQQEYLSQDGGSSPRRKLRLVLPEKTSSRPPTALERKIR